MSGSQETEMETGDLSSALSANEFFLFDGPGSKARLMSLRQEACLAHTMGF